MSVSSGGVPVNEERAMVRAAGQIGFYTLLSRVIGLLRDVIIGSVFGAGLRTDAPCRPAVTEAIPSAAFCPFDSAEGAC